MAPAGTAAGGGHAGCGGLGNPVTGLVSVEADNPALHEILRAARPVSRVLELGVSAVERQAALLVPVHGPVGARKHGLVTRGVLIDVHHADAGR